jgi:hypothetical protein
MMFSMAAEGKNCTDIVRALNRKNILIDGRDWNNVTVLHMLTNPKYTGSNIWHRHTQRLHTPLRIAEPRFWIGKPLAFSPIVDQRTFDRAQATLQKMRDSRWPDGKILKRSPTFAHDKRESQRDSASQSSWDAFNINDP